MEFIGSSYANTPRSSVASMHATAPPFVPPQYNSFGTEISGPTNKHLVIEEEFHRSASSESLRRTSQGFDYEFSYVRTAESVAEKAVEDDTATASDSSYPIETKMSKGRKKSKAARHAKNQDVVVETSDDGKQHEDLKIEQVAARVPSKDVEGVQHRSESEAPHNTSVTDQVPAAETTEATEGSAVPSNEQESAISIENIVLPEIQSELDAWIHPREAITSLSAETLPVPVAESVTESRAESVVSEAPTEILSDTAGEKTFSSTVRKTSVPASSIHPFAKAKVTSAQRPVSKVDKKKTKKQGQANKKKTEFVASFLTEPTEPEILSLDEMKAKSKSKATPSKSAATAIVNFPLTEANVDALEVPAAESNSPVLESGAPLLEVEESIIVLDTTKGESVASRRFPVVPKGLPTVVLPLLPAISKRNPSFIIMADLPRQERKSSTASVASDSSMGTPKTAKEYQTPIPSPAPDMSSSRSVTPFAEWEESNQATAGAEAQPELESELVPVDNSISAIQTKKSKKKKSKKKKKTNSVDASHEQEDSAGGQPQDGAAPKGLMSMLGCTGMDQDSSPNAEATSPELHDDNTASGTSSVMTDLDEKSEVSKNKTITKTSSKENAAPPRLLWAHVVVGKSPTTAHLPNKGGLTTRNPNAGQHSKGG